MLRMDLLLNPGSPPSSPVRSQREDNQVGANDVVVEPTLGRGQQLNQSYSPPLKTPDSPSSVPAVKRLKRDLPTLRLLLDNTLDNQRDDAPHEIFSGHAFWGQVPSLNPSPSPSDITQVGAATSMTSRKSFVRELDSKPFLPSLPHVINSTVRSTKEVGPSDEAEQSSPSEEGDSLPSKSTSTTPSAKGTKKKKITICKEDGCTSQALSKQLCMKHGGGPRCSVPDCNNGAKLRNLCFQHGGSTICLAEGCSSKSKRFGYCWSHGGGRICGDKDCDKVAAQGGMCWAHGGGNRCKLDGCTKRSYKQHGYYCKRHAEVSADY